MAIEHSDIYKIAAHHRFQWEKAQDCYVILFPEGMVKLNSSAGEVLKLVDGSTSTGEIVTKLQEQFPDVGEIEKDILAMLDFAIGKAWIEKVN
jgi:pyrroloquinoline quinone biosynthesis protein D